MKALNHPRWRPRPTSPQSAWERFLSSGKKKPEEIRRWVWKNRNMHYVPEEVLAAFEMGTIYDGDGMPAA